ncbi:MAG: hypothetical protein KDE54_14840 [Caldilineaceae bacterium]|nr:hypothetical protein [Caldilineaceae bacterium]MCB0138384.1 hypothetical protein [Caldilineaceae bacterium]
MDSFDQLDNIGPEDYLDKAIERLDAGEPLDAILSSYPADVRGELRDMLEVVDAVQYTASTPPPPMSASRRSAAKAQFLAAAAEMRTQSHTPTSVNSSNHSSSQAGGQSYQDADLTDVAHHNHAAQHNMVRQQNVEHYSGKPQLAGTDVVSQATRPGFWANLTQDISAGFQSLFGAGSMRLAPIAALVVVMLLGSISVFNVAWSIPGDLTYPIKEWSRRVGLQLVPESEREAIREAQDKVRAQELAQAIAKADRNSIVITETVTEIYRGQNSGNDLLTFGSVVVMPRYQPDANVNTEFLPMQIVGELVPGAEVELTYQIMPGQQGQPGIVQGIAVQVVAPPPIAVTAPTSTTAPTATEPPPATVCRVSPPAGWTQYVVSANDTLGALAISHSVSTRYLAQVNCLVSANSIQSGMAIFVPGVQAQPAVATSVPVNTPTNAGVDTLPITVTAPVTVTAVNPGAGETMVTPTSTVVVTGTPLPAVTAVPTSPVASTSVSGTQPTVAPTQVITGTVAPTAEPTLPENAPATVTTETPPDTPTLSGSPPLASPTEETPTPATEATIEPSALPPETATPEPQTPVDQTPAAEDTPVTENGGDGTAASGDTPVDGSSGETATPEIVPNVTPVVITQSPTSTPTEAATVALPATQVPTEAPTTAAVPTEPVLPPTDTAVPPTPAPPTPVPPTPVPPTPVPPTPIPPTPVPPTPVPPVEQPPADSGA